MAFPGVPLEMTLINSPLRLALNWCYTLIESIRCDAICVLLLLTIWLTAVRCISTQTHFLRRSIGRNLRTTYVTESARSARGLSPLPVRSSGTVFQTPSGIRKSPKLF